MTWRNLPQNYANLVASRPIYAELPGVQKGYADLEVADPDNVLDSAYLVEFWEQRYLEWRVTVGVLRRAIIQPDLLTSYQLDFLAPFFGWSGPYWDTGWSNSVKLGLLSNTFQGARIWENKGNPETIAALFRIFGLPFVLRPLNGFIVAVSIIHVDKIGGSQWEYEIVIPQNTPANQVAIAEWIIKYFTPYWSRVRIFKRTTP